MPLQSGTRGEGAWVLVARGTTLRGSKGLLTARVPPATPSPFRPGLTLRFCRKGSAREIRLASVEQYRDRVVLRLEGVDTAASAEPLAGSDIFLQSKDLVDLPEGTYYIFRLVGLDVIVPGNRCLGRVADVLRTGGSDLLLVQGEGSREFLIPFARAICRRVDLEAGIIEVDPPAGLLEIDAV